MSGIHHADRVLLDSLKTEIEKKAGLQHSEKWSQKDYDFLIFYIEEHGGIKISLTTLKRIWKNEYSRLPHIHTLDALSRIAFGKDWHTLKMENVPPPKPEILPVHAKKSNRNWLWVILLPAAAAIFFFLRPEADSESYEHVRFSAKTTVSNAIPNTVIFDYDVSRLKGDTFFLQQSWDVRRRIRISKNDHSQTDIYYLPGYYKAKLLSGNQIIREYPVHITTDGWIAAAHQDNLENVILHDAGFSATGAVNLNNGLLRSHGIHTGDPFTITMHNSREFGIDGDRFVFNATLRMDSSATSCPVTSIVIKGAEQFFLVNLGRKGCESNLNLQISEKKISGKKNDLSAFGTDIYRNNHIKILAMNHKLFLYLNHKMIAEIPYMKPVGKLKELVFILNGTAIISDVALSQPEPDL